MKTSEQIKEDMARFIEEIRNITASSDYQAMKELDEKIKNYISVNKITTKQNEIRLSGYGEMLEMALSAHEWENKHE